MRNFLRKLFCNHNYVIIDYKTLPNGRKVMKRMCTKCLDVETIKI